MNPIHTFTGINQYLFFLIVCLVALSQVLTAQESIKVPAVEQMVQQDTFAMSIELDDIVVTAQYAPTDSKNAVQQIRTITRVTIEQQGANNLEQLLQQDLNIRINQDLILGSSMSLLGVSGENIKIMIDGVPVVGRLDGNIDLSQINLNNIERVEIVEGPMSVSYGTDALGGVINLITKKSQLLSHELTLRQQLETRAESSSSFDGGIKLDDNWLLRVNGGRDWFNGFSEDTTRSVLWNPKEQWYADASLRYDFGADHRVIYRFSYFNEEVQNLGDVRRPQFKPYAFDDYYLTNRLNHNLLHEGSLLKNYYWQNTLGFNTFDRNVNTYRLDFEEDAQASTAGDTTAFKTYTLRSTLASRFRNSNFNFQVGVDANYEIGEGARIVDEASDRVGMSSIYDYAIFGSLRYQPNRKWIAETGLRYAKNSKYDAPLIPSFHLKYQMNDNLLWRVSYGKGFRSPSLKELYLSFIDINHFIIGNPDLQAETSNNLQTNLSYNEQFNQHRISANFKLFYNQIKDQIQLFPFIENDGIITPVTPNQSTQYAYFNLENSKTQGGNLSISYGWKNFSLEGGVSRIGFYNPLSATLANVDEFTYSNEINGKLGYEIPFSETNINAFIRKNDRFISYYPVEENGATVARQRIQEGFTMLDATIVQDFLNDRLSISAGVRNLLNITQVSVTGGGAGAHSSGSGVPIGAGRSFFVSATLRLFDNKAAKFKNRPFEQQQKRAFRLSHNQDQLYASWIENQNDGEQLLQFSTWKNKDWSRPKTIQIGNNQWFINEVDAPQIFISDNEKQLTALWLQKSNARNVYDHHIWLSQSNNKGKTWQSSFKPYDTDIPAFYGLAKMIAINQDQSLLVWMDGRATKKLHEPSGRYFPTKEGRLTIRSAELSKSGKLNKEQTVSDDINPLCPFDAVTTEKGGLLAYRNRQSSVIVRQYNEGIWQTAEVISNEKNTSQTTIESPAIDAHESKVALVWINIFDDKPSTLSFATSNDYGEQFSSPISLPTNRLVGKVDVLILSNKSVILSWEEEQQLMIVQMNEQHEIIASKKIPLSKNVRLKSSSMLAETPEGVVLAWYDYDAHVELLDFDWQ